MADTNTITQIVCYACDESKPFDLFPKMPTGKYGRNTTCKACRAVYLKQYQLDNKERLRLAHKERYAAKKYEYQEKNRQNYIAKKEEYKIRAKKWASENVEKRREVVKKYLVKNPEKRKETVQRYTKENAAYYVAAYKARQQRKRKAMPSWANQESIKAMYRQAAWVQKMTGVKQHVDHYYPLKNELVCGLHVEHNLRIIPAKENLSKGNNFPEEQS